MVRLFHHTYCYCSALSLLFRTTFCIAHSIKMEIFQLIQNNFKLLGITPNQSSQKHPLNANLLAVLNWCIFSTASYVLWYFYTANSFSDYMDSALFAFESLICTSGLLVLIWKMEQWFRFIKNLQIVLNKSELRI